MRISFVILHYLAEEVTSSSINALLNICEGHDADIIVVDNASENGSGRHLADRYKGHDNVHFIFMPANEGFSRGNNAGYQFAKDKLSPDFIVVMNNDVMIYDKTFLDKIHKEYLSAPFAVLGPDIHSSKTNMHQSPSRLTPMSYAEVLQTMEKLSQKCRHYTYSYFTWKLKVYLGMTKEENVVIPDNESDKPHTGCVLHGACYVFSRDFIDKREYAFNPSTFLYLEEDILNFECLRDGLIMRYSPFLSVEHLEDISTAAIHKTAFTRSKMKMVRTLDSLRVLAELMKN